MKKFIFFVSLFPIILLMPHGSTAMIVAPAGPTIWNVLPRVMPAFEATAIIVMGDKFIDITEIKLENTNDLSIVIPADSYTVNTDSNRIDSVFKLINSSFRILEPGYNRLQSR